ncbi:MAG: HD domain-containing protein [Myxococcota bacterium]
MNPETPVARVGSLAWARRGGALSALERRRLVAGSLARQVALVGDVLRRLGPPAGPLRAVELGEIRIPDSRAALEAAEHARALSSDVLYAHCIRTYLYGALFARADGLTYDPELLFVAAALHDLGLVPAHRHRAPGVACFAVEGARAAADFAEATLGWEDARRARLEEAITLHLNLAVDAEEGVEAHLLHEATALDVVGTRAGVIGRRLRRAIREAHPREGLEDEVLEAFRDEARTRPHSRTGVMMRLGFPLAMRLAR